MGLQLFLRAREGSSRGDFRDKKEGEGGEKTRFKKYLTL